MILTVFLLQSGMRSYLNGGGSNVGTPPPLGGRPLPRPGGMAVMGGRASSSSLPRSPETADSSFLTSGLGTGSGSLLGGSTSGQSGQGSLLGSGQGSLGSHSSHINEYMNIYQNTNHPHLYVSHRKYLFRVYKIDNN